MRLSRLPIALCVILAVGCATGRRQQSRVTTSPLATQQDVADGLVRAGCLDCLLGAFQSYERLHASGPPGEERLIGLARIGILIAIRERELGLEDSGHLARARLILAATTSRPHSLRELMAIADLLPARVEGAALDDTMLRRRRAGRLAYDAHVAFLNADADRDALAAYLWLSFNCAYGDPDRERLQAWLEAVPTWRHTPLLVYRAATCGVLDLGALERLLATDTRFAELHYFMALASPPAAETDLTMPHFDLALAWRPLWSVALLARANAHFEREAFDEALADFDRLLSLRLRSPDALLGRVRALTHLTRYEEALRTSDDLLALGQWYIGDAHFWRALIELQLGRLDPAWTEIEVAASLLVNADVPKLAGIIAARRQELDVARQQFQDSRRRNPKDCETTFHLGNVLSQQRSWAGAADAYRETMACIDSDEQRLAEEIASLLAAAPSSDHRRRQIARRDEQIAAGRQMRSAAWFNTAVGYFNLSRFDDARLAAERVLDDPFYGSQARALLARLAR